MSNLTKIVMQMRQERDDARKRVEQLEQALAALGMDGLRKPADVLGSSEQSAGHVGPGSKKNRGSAARSMGKVEGGQAR